MAEDHPSNFYGQISLWNLEAIQGQKYEGI